MVADPVDKQEISAGSLDLDQAELLPVADNLPGIPPQVQDAMHFTPFGVGAFCRP